MSCSDSRCGRLPVLLLLAASFGCSNEAAIKAAILPGPPTPAHPLDVTFDATTKLLGWDSSPAVAEPGQPMTLTFYWHAAAPAKQDWRVFVHVEGKYKARFQADHEPVGAAYPTSRWKVGETIKDEWTVEVPAEWSVAEAVLWVGLYRGDARAVVEPGTATDGANRVRGGTLAFKAAAVKRLRVPRRAMPPVVDGALDDPVWAGAADTGIFEHTMKGGEVDPRTTARLIWHETGLYVGFDCVDEDVHSSFTSHDDPIYKEEAVELFLDGDADGVEYVELQVSPAGVIFDSRLMSYRRNDNAWNSGMLAAVKVNGTLNDPSDTDVGWTAEMHVPWSAVIDAVNRPPNPGDVWRANLFRLDMARSAKFSSGGAWSPPMVGDFHALHRFGELEFIAGP